MTQFGACRRMEMNLSNGRDDLMTCGESGHQWQSGNGMGSDLLHPMLLPGVEYMPLQQRLSRTALTQALLSV